MGRPTSVRAPQPSPERPRYGTPSPCRPAPRRRPRGPKRRRVSPLPYSLRPLIRILLHQGWVRQPQTRARPSLPTVRSSHGPHTELARQSENRARTPPPPAVPTHHLSPPV